MLFGYRRAGLDELIRFDESTTSLSGPTIDTTFDISDQFAAENQFHGGQIGIEYMGPAIRCWSLGLLAKVAIGYNRSQIAIGGETVTTTAAGDVSTSEGGLLTQASNIGNDTDEEFSTLSELGVSLNRRWPGISANATSSSWGSDCATTSPRNLRCPWSSWRARVPTRSRSRCPSTPCAATA